MKMVIKVPLATETSCRHPRQVPLKGLFYSPKGSHTRSLPVHTLLRQGIEPLRKIHLDMPAVAPSTSKSMADHGVLLRKDLERETVV